MTLTATGVSNVTVFHVSFVSAPNDFDASSVPSSAHKFPVRDTSVLEESRHQRTPVITPGCITVNRSPISRPLLFVTSAAFGGRAAPQHVLVAVVVLTVPETEWPDLKFPVRYASVTVAVKFTEVTALPRSRR